jgi:phosphonate transport system substrate-binding protein
MNYLKLLVFVVWIGCLALIISACSFKNSDTFIALTELASSQTSVEASSDDQEPLKFAIVSILSISETHRTYDKFSKYLEEQLGRPVEIIQKQTYSEVKELFEQNKIDAGIVCAYLAVVGRQDGFLKKIAMPVINGEKQFTSYIITQKDSDISSIKDLHRKKFAYSDPLSYSGYLVTKYNIFKDGFDFDGYFSHAYFTYSHDNTILAVANGLVDGGATHSVVYDQLSKEKNPLIENLKIIGEGEFVGHSPVVINPTIDPELEKKLTDIFLTMHLNDKGKLALLNLNFDYFDMPQRELFEPIIKMLDELGELQ